MKTIENKVVIVTGASSGIGRAAALMFAMAGAKVVACARRTDELESLCAQASQQGQKIVAVTGDVTDDACQRELVSTATERFGRLDAAFNNAGLLGELAPIDQVSLEGWHHTLETNLTSAMLAARAQVPAMIKSGGGSIVFTGSFVGHTAGMPGMAAYAASKAGLLGLVKVLAVELATSKIRVNAIVSGGVDTPMGRTVADTPESLAFVENLHAMKRVGQPEEIAQAALFLINDASSFMTGVPMLVDGGASICKT